MAKFRSKRPQQDFTRYHEKLKADAQAARDSVARVRFCRLRRPCWRLQTKLCFSMNTLLWRTCRGHALHKQVSGQQLSERCSDAQQCMP